MVGVYAHGIGRRAVIDGSCSSSCVDGGGGGLLVADDMGRRASAAETEESMVCWLPAACG